MSIDIARAHHTPATLRSIVDAIAARGGSSLVLHLSDDEGFAVESPYLALTATDSSRPRLSRAQVRSLLEYANGRGVAVIPDLDVPAHGRAWIERVRAVRGVDIAQKDDAGRSVVDFYANPAADKAVSALLTEVLDLFAQPTLGRAQDVVIGGDEVPGAKSHPADFAAFMNRTARLAVARGYTPRVWNDMLTDTSLAALDPTIDVVYWSQSGDKAGETGPTVEQVMAAGHDVVNANSWTQYFMPAPERTPGDITEQCDYVAAVYSLDRFNLVDSVFHVAPTDRVVGAQLSFWNERAAEMTQAQLVSQEVPLVDAFLRASA